ncbi:MAG: C40 family peptidase [Coriobacteriales bacterium]|jgi:cell wall-associated NlpC family hydrolase|nr:C40 family peptidase [Coriobacteriales bacterium]
MFLGISAAASGLLVASSPLLAFADPTSAEKQAEADQVKAKLDEWAAALDDASNRYYEAVTAHDTATAAMEDAQGRMDAAEDELTRLQERLGVRASSMYKQGPLSFFEVLFGARSFSEFTSSWDLLNTLNSDDAVLIQQSKQLKVDAQNARDDYTMQAKIAEQKLNEANEIKAEAEATVTAYEAELSSLEEEVAALIQKEKEEEERRQAAEAAAAAAAAAMANNGGSQNWVGDSSIYDVGTYSSIVEAAYSRLGCPYVWAASGPTTFDCSGLTSWCYRQVGISIPRGGNAQYSSAPIQMPVSEAQPGDILWHYNHVGIYIGGGQFIHAPQTGDVVRIASNMGMWTGASRWL